MKKVTGIGGVFFKSDDPGKLKDWYKNHLGLQTTEYGCTFFWHPLDDPNLKARTEWSVFKKDTKYFEPGKKEFMINFRVHDLKALISELKKEGVDVVGEIEEYEYGKFGWIMDPNGNKIELWEPVDEVLNKFDEDKK
jgi:predicted enzyme related to lactoylglutathione lyase